MSAIFFISVVLKGIGAVLEVLLQVFITRELGVAGYGTYSTWINAADLVFWVLFSGLMKCDTFYLSEKETSISRFKRRYYFGYAIPVLAVMSIVSVLATGRFYYGLGLIITGLELVVLDRSSTMIAGGKATVSLIGEYILGRVILVGGVLVLSATKLLSLNLLLLLYIFQYIVVIIFYVVKGKNQGQLRDISNHVSVTKWAVYQGADIMQAMIGQLPVLLQYFFSGAFEAGIVSIVLLVKKLINFISGPSAKIFLPEFSRLYREGKKDALRDSYASIMRIQMMFVGPMAVALIGFPGIVLSVLADELLEYTGLFTACAVVFLLVATLGPCSGVLQMTGNEKKDNLFRIAALLVMAVVMVALFGNSMFVLYGLCIQAVVETGAKYLYVCRWMGGPPVKVLKYVSWWIVPVCTILFVKLMHIQNSFVVMIAAVCGVFAFEVIQELRCDSSLIRNILKKRGG